MYQNIKKTLFLSTLIAVSFAFLGCTPAITSNAIGNNQYEVTVNGDNIGAALGVQLTQAALARKWAEKAVATCPKGFNVITRNVSELAATGIIECK